MRTRISFVLVLLALSYGVGAAAATFNVSRSDDPAPNGCLAGDCSLREAVVAANANVDSDTILLPAGTFALTLGELVISNSVVVRGVATASTRIDGDGDDALIRINGSPIVRLEAMTLRAHGAHAIDVSRQAQTTLDQLFVPSDSEIWVDVGLLGNGRLEIRRSEIRAYVTCGSLAICRIIDSQLVRLQVGDGSNAQTDVDIQTSVFDGDLAPANGAGMAIQTNGAVSIVDTRVTHTGLGIQFSAGTPTQIVIVRLQFIENAAAVRVFVPAPVTIVDSVFSNNLSEAFGGGPGAIHATGGSNWQVRGSLFTSNSGSGTVGGAALVEAGAKLTINNSTFAGNTFTAAAAQLGARGAAVGFRGHPSVTLLLLRHTTLVPPTVFPSGIFGTVIGGTGNDETLIVNLFNSIIRGSCFTDADNIDLTEGNVESPGNSCGMSAVDNAINVSTSGLALGTLADHGGLTNTYLPSAASAAVDIGASTFCLGTDQRGFARPVGASCDAGSTEIGAVNQIEFRNGFE